MQRGNDLIIIPNTGRAVSGERDMNITLNGEKRAVPAGITVRGLLESLNIQQERVAVELNLAIVKKNAYDATLIKEGDSLEVVSFMQGGCSYNFRFQQLTID